MNITTFSDYFEFKMAFDNIIISPRRSDTIKITHPFARGSSTESSTTDKILFGLKDSWRSLMFSLLFKLAVLIITKLGIPSLDIVESVFELFEDRFSEEHFVTSFCSIVSDRSLIVAMFTS